MLAYPIWMHGQLSILIVFHYWFKSREAINRLFILKQYKHLDRWKIRLG